MTPSARVLRPTITSKPRDEGPTVLQVPVAAAKEEQLTEHVHKVTDLLRFAAIETRRTGAREQRVAGQISTDRQVTQPSSASNSLMSTAVTA